MRLLRPRNYVYTGEPIPEWNAKDHAAFLAHFQKSILCSLEKRGLITHSQKERCELEVEKLYTRSDNKHQV